MHGFAMISGNRLERLAGILAQRTQERSGDPFTPETIVIQSRGMERWLALAIARQLGVAANLHFPFPEAFIRTVIKAVLPEVPEAEPFQRDVMLFAIFALLPRCMEKDPAFDPLRGYLHQDERGAKRLQLAQRIAYLFDQYQIFRPDMIFAWDEGRPTGDGHHRWQAKLWRKLTRRLPGIHRARLWQRTIDVLRQGRLPEGVLPRRISVFGISYLPPFHLQVFLALSAVMEVAFYQLNPCREYWADIVSRGEETRLQRPWREAPRPIPADDFHMEEGNRLLASMGRQGRAFHRLIGDFDCQVQEDFHDDRGDSLLTHLQADILNLRTGPNGKNAAALRLKDRSIQIHACHSPMREVEVLHDHVLDFLNHDPELQPRDILVLTPDIDTYAPYIQAVFGAPEDETHRLPFSIADRKPVQGHPVVEAFTYLLGINQSRFPASELTTLIEIPAVRRAFDLAEDDLPLIGQWIAATRIRWGLDARSKSHWGLPDREENTWRAGLDRLVLGYAFAPEKPHLFKGILPAPEAEASDAETIGRLVRFVDALGAWQIQAGRPMPLGDWPARLRQLLDTFFSLGPDNPEDENDLQLLRRLIAGMQQQAAAAQAEEAVDVEVIRTYLKQRLEEERSGGGFISGGITFAALLPMRSIPAKVICLLGMNQELFPREDRPLGFDLMAAHPRMGDRSRRDDDKYLFLEALISARQTFYLSYIGYDIQDNAGRPPSVLISELIDYIAEAYHLSDSDLMTSHRLQGFSEASFSVVREGLFTYSRQARDAARSLARARRTTPVAERIVNGPLPDWDARFQTVDIEALGRALGHPSRFLLEKRMGVKLYDDPGRENDRESFVLDPLERFSLGQDLTRQLITPPYPSHPLDIARAEGRLPHGAPGHISFDDIYREAEDIAAAVRDLQSDSLPVTLPVQAQIDSFTITGVLNTIFPAGQISYRYGHTRGVDLIDAWLRHLLWCRASDRPLQCVTLVINRDGRRRFGPVDRVEDRLKTMLSLYHRAGHEPVPLFPRASWQYATLRFENELPAETALERVRSRWQQSYALPGDADDPYIQHCFGDLDPLDETFVRTTEALYGPILNNSEPF
jgi:exodeoxyribonuclease V gamma subunit